MGNRIKQYVVRHLSYIRGAGSVIDLAGSTWTASAPRVHTGSFQDDAEALNRDWVKHFPEYQRECTDDQQKLLFSR